MPVELIQHIPIELIDPDPANPRKSYDASALERLALTVRAGGVEQPVRLRRTESGRYLLVFGERRWRAGLLAQQTTLPAVVEEYDGSQAPSALMLRRLIEGCTHEELPPLELADAIEELMASEGLSAREVAARIGLSESHVCKLRALRKQLSPDLQHAVAEGKLGLKDAYELTTAKGERISADRLARKVKAAERAARHPRKKVTLAVAAGCSVAVVAPDLSLDALAEWLSTLANRAREAGARGVSVEAFAASLRPAKVSRLQDGVAA